MMQQVERIEVRKSNDDDLRPMDDIDYDYYYGDGAKYLEGLLNRFKDVAGPVNEFEDKDVPRLLMCSMPRAWARWGSQAVYFAAETDDVLGADGSTEYGGLSIYAIDTTDEHLPVYHVFDFTFPLVYGRAIFGLSCAIVGSSAYVTGNGRLWIRQIDKDQGWVDGPQFTFNGCSPQLLSLGGRLYALRFFGLCNPTSEASRDVFEVLVGGSWRSLSTPPPSFWDDSFWDDSDDDDHAHAHAHDDDDDGESCEHYRIAGCSCIGDHTIIFHLANYHTKRQRFFRFQHSTDFLGSWTELEVTFSASPSPSPFPCEVVTHCSHLYSDDPLLLPVLSRATMFPVFGLSVESDVKHLQLEVGQEVPLLPWKPLLDRHEYLPWLLFSMGRSRYCAIAFTNTNRLAPTVFTFDLHLAGATASLKNVNFRCHEFGDQRICHEMSGKA